MLRIELPGFEDDVSLELHALLEADPCSSSTASGATAAGSSEEDYDSDFAMIDEMEDDEDMDMLTAGVK